MAQRVGSILCLLLVCWLLLSGAIANIMTVVLILDHIK